MSKNQKPRKVQTTKIETPRNPEKFKQQELKLLMSKNWRSRKVENPENFKQQKLKLLMPTKIETPQVILF